MLLETAPIDRPSVAPVTGVTIGALLDWIAASDDRCHDEGVRPAVAAALVTAGVEPFDAGVVALVRALVLRTVEDPGWRDAVIPGEGMLQHPLV